MMSISVERKMVETHASQRLELRCEDKVNIEGSSDMTRASYVGSLPLESESSPRDRRTVFPIARKRSLAETVSPFWSPMPETTVEGVQFLSEAQAQPGGYL
jgi:hypothetical protein